MENVVSYCVDEYELIERWYHGQYHYHNELGPAYVAYDKNGLKVFEGFYIMGEEHRNGMPAKLWKSGYHEFWENGIYIKQAPVIEF